MCECVYACVCVYICVCVCVYLGMMMLKHKGNESFFLQCVCACTHRRSLINTHTTHTITQVCEKEEMGGGGEENQGEVGRDSGDETRRMK